jgi:Uma2 family endonuclease
MNLTTGVKCGTLKALMLDARTSERIKAMSETAAESIVPFPPYVENWEMPEMPSLEDLPEDDNVPMESSWHRDAMNFLIELIRSHMEGRTDFYAGGNMFIHFSATQVRNNDFRGPDVFFVKGVDGTRLRKFWAVWLEEGRYPDVIVELLSPCTAKQDRTTKKAIYEKIFQTRNYFIYDPDERRLEGWQLNKGKYEPLVPNEHGWLWSDKLEAWLGTWAGLYHRTMPDVWLRLFDAEGGLVLSFDEKAQQRAREERRQAEEALQRERRQAEEALQRERRQAEEALQRAVEALQQERQRADEALQLAGVAAQRAVEADERMATERQRAEAAEGELARLRALLKAKGGSPQA